MSKAPPASRLRRSTIGALAAGRAGLRHLGHKAAQLTRAEEEKQSAQEEHEAQLGKILFQALNQLKGTALKLSQMLSMEAQFLPPALRQELSKAWHQVTPLNRALVHKLFSREFGHAPQELFAEFEMQAFAAASLGQVHAARLRDGREVALKLQYPGIANSISSDMQMLRTLLQTFAARSSHMPDSQIMDSIMDEMERKLAEELDYQQEAEQMRWFAANITLPGLVLPEVVAEHSTRSVLCMTRLHGKHLQEWLAQNPGQEERNAYGQLIFDWFIHASFELQRVHADPHPGNFLFLPDGRLGLLDFGCTRTLQPEFCRKITYLYQTLINTVADPAAHAEQQLAAYVELGLLGPDLSLQCFRDEVQPALAAVQRWQTEAFVQDEFDFSQKSPHPQADTRNAPLLSRVLHRIDNDLLYFDRNLMGVMHLLQQLQARVKTKNAFMCRTV